MRNSDPDAAVYWIARMLEAGEDPLYIARRMVRFASEDIGNADPQALVVADRREGCGALHRHARRQHRARAGGDLPGHRARRATPCTPPTTTPAADAHREAAEPVPLHLRNAPTKLMKELELRQGTTSTRTTEPDAIAAMDCLPPSLAGRKCYRPTDRGFEKEIKRRLDGWEKVKEERRRK